MIVEFYAEQIKLGACYCEDCNTWFKGDYCHNCGKPNEWRDRPRICLNENCKHQQVFGHHCTECGWKLPEPEGGLEDIPKTDFGEIDAPILGEDEILSWRKEEEKDEPGPV